MGIDQYDPGLPLSRMTVRRAARRGRVGLLGHLPPHVIVCSELQWPPSCPSTARITSVGAAESANDELVDAELLFGGFHRQSPMECFADPEVELAGEGALRQRVGDGLAL